MRKIEARELSKLLGLKRVISIESVPTADNAFFGVERITITIDIPVEIIREAQSRADAHEAMSRGKPGAEAAA